MASSQAVSPTKSGDGAHTRQSTLGSRSGSFLAGARDTVPMLFGASPFGVIFGAVAAAGVLQLWQGQLMSLSVFAGSSQFIGVSLMTGQAGIFIICLTTLIVNLRHMLYGATLLPKVAHLPARWRFTLGFFMTDETFAVMSGHYARHPAAPNSHWYFFGSCMVMYWNWQFWTFVGLMFGVIFPQAQSLGLEFAMAVTFIAIVVPQLVVFPKLAAALAAGGIACLTLALPYKLGLMLSVAVGISVGMLVSRWRDQGLSASGAGR